jgi:hypothetical protein
MKSRQLSVILVAGVAASLLFASSPVSAGAEYAASEYCSSSATGGSCSGTFLGFRSGTGTNDFMSFESGLVAGTTYYGFFASYGNTDYSCSFPSSLSAAVAPILTSARGWFEVEWNAQGQCTAIYVDEDSAYSQTW